MIFARIKSFVILILIISCSNLYAIEKETYKCENKSFHIPKAKKLDKFSWEIYQSKHKTQYIFLPNNTSKLPRAEFHYCSSASHGHLFSYSIEENYNNLLSLNEEWITIDREKEKNSLNDPTYSRYITYTMIELKSDLSEYTTHVQIELKYDNESQRQQIHEWASSIKFIAAPKNATNKLKLENGIQF